MLRWFAILQFSVLTAFTASLSLSAAIQYANTPAIQIANEARIVNAVQDQRISQLERAFVENTQRMDALSKTVAEMAGAMNRLNGIGIGFLSLLTIMQGFRMFVQHKNDKRKF